MLAGPCQMESRAHALEMASALKEIAAGLGIGLVYKSSFDKANRTSLSGKRGIGLERRCRCSPRSARRWACPSSPTCTKPAQCARVAPVVDVLQIPAFLCRQTDLLIAAAQTGRVVNVKKGQFLAPWDMKNVVAKIVGSRQPERAADRARRVVRLQHARRRHARAADHGRDGCPGDFRRHALRAAAGRAGTSSGGDRRVRASAGARRRRRRRGRRLHRDAPGPGRAPSDGPNMVPLARNSKGSCAISWTSTRSSKSINARDPEGPARASISQSYWDDITAPGRTSGSCARSWPIRYSPARKRAAVWMTREYPSS